MSRTDRTHELELHEYEYLHELDRHLRDLPRSPRAELFTIARDHLADRPATSHGEELQVQLGRPGDYAEALRAAHGLPPERTDWWARWLAKSRKLRYLGVGLALVITVASIAGTVSYQRWVHWQADLEAIGSGVTYADTEHPEGIELTMAGGLTQANVPFRHDDALRVDLMLTSKDDVTLTGIVFEGAGSALLGSPTIEVSTSTAATSAFHPWHPVTLRPRGAWIRLVMPFEGCESFGSEGDRGGYTSYSLVTVTYQARGRERTQTIALPVVVSVQNPAPGECPDRAQPQ